MTTRRQTTEARSTHRDPGRSRRGSEGVPNRKATTAFLDRRAEILQAAGEIFYEKSYPSATMNDVAERAGLLKQLIYYYFESKEELLFELVTGERCLAFIRGFEELDKSLAQLDAPTRLKAFTTRWIQSVESRNPTLLDIERDCRHLSLERQQVVATIRKRFPSLLEAILQQGIEDEDFRPSFAVSVAASNILAILRDLYAWYDPPGSPTVEELTDWHCRFILGGLGVSTD